jgi:hypothetical protein
VIFTAWSIDKINVGEKTETRRVWRRPHVRVGGVYRCRTTRFARADDTHPRIRVLSVRRERLGEITRAGARREGCRSVSEFIALWHLLHGAWTPDIEVTVVRFEVVE